MRKTQNGALFAQKMITTPKTAGRRKIRTEKISIQEERPRMIIWIRRKITNINQEGNALHALRKVTLQKSAIRKKD